MVRGVGMVRGYRVLGVGYWVVGCQVLGVGLEWGAWGLGSEGLGCGVIPIPYSPTPYSPKKTWPTTGGGFNAPDFFQGR